MKRVSALCLTIIVVLMMVPTHSAKAQDGGNVLGGLIGLDGVGDVMQKETPPGSPYPNGNCEYSVYVLKSTVTDSTISAIKDAGFDEIFLGETAEKRMFQMNVPGPCPPPPPALKSSDKPFTDRPSGRGFRSFEFAKIPTPVIVVLALLVFMLAGGLLMFAR